MKINRILLMNCPLELSDGIFPRAYPPLGLAYLAASLLAAEYEVIIHDPVIQDIDRPSQGNQGKRLFGADEDTLAKILGSSAADLIGISTQFADNASQTHRLARLAKTVSPKSMVVVGGHYPSLMPVRALADEHIDYIAIGESEQSFRQLVDCLNGKGMFPEYIYSRDNIADLVPQLFPSARDLDSLPFPARRLLSMEHYFEFFKENDPFKPLQNPATTILATRGCPNRCSFCMHSAYSGTSYQKRSIANIREEIELLVDEYGIKEVIFVDDNLTHSRSYTTELCTMLTNFKSLSWYMMSGTEVNSLTPAILEQLSRSGCYRMRLSVESGSTRTLQMMRKKVDLKKAKELIRIAKSLGILVQGQFIIGMPGETIQDIEQTIGWAEEADCDYTTFSIATPYPGTEMYKYAEEKGFLLDDELDLIDMHNGKGRIATPLFTPQLLEHYRKSAWEDINFKSADKTSRAEIYIDPAKYHGHGLASGLARRHAPLPIEQTNPG